VDESRWLSMALLLCQLLTIQNLISYFVTRYKPILYTRDNAFRIPHFDYTCKFPFTLFNYTINPCLFQELQ